jgi:hypothetical protein
MKSKYESHVLPRLNEIEAWCRDGLTEVQMCEKLGIAPSSFGLYKNQHSELSDLLTRTKAYVDDVVVVPAYLKRITGYTATEWRREYACRVDPETGEIKRTLMKETSQERHVPGDPRAAEFWLCNRNPQKWKRVPDTVDESGHSGGIIEIPSVIGEEGKNE